MGLWTLAGSWSARNLTDGHVTAARVRKFGGTSAEVTELVKANLWIVDGNGWRFKSWDEYQPTKESVEKERAAARKRMQDRRSKGKNVTPTSGDVRANTDEQTENNGRSNAGCSGTPSLPIPSRPNPTTSPKTEKEEKPPRPEVEALCTLLADRIEANGSRRPRITKTWQDPVRLLMDKDGYTAEQVAWIINWSQSDEFWRTNILSTTKLREKFDQLKLKATSESKPAPRLSKRQQEIADYERRRGLTPVPALEIVQ